MKHIYMSISITMYPNGLTPDCTYWEKLDDGEMVRRKLPLDKARKMQWELMKAGAERRYRSNMFNNAISNVDVDYWVRR